MQQRCPECETMVVTPTLPMTPAARETGHDEEATSPEVALQAPCPHCGTDVLSVKGAAALAGARWRVPRGGAAMWARVLDRWDQEPAHRAFIAFCREAGCLDYAARRYRRRHDTSPEQVERTTWALAEIRDQAMAGLVPVLRKEPPRHRGITMAISGILAAGLALWLGYALRGCLFGG